MDDAKRASELNVINRPVPATSNVAPGEAVWIPTFEELFTMKAGVALDCVGIVVVLNSLADTPVSITKVPVVCTRTRSEEEEPLNKRSSCVPPPVEISARTVLL